MNEVIILQSADVNLIHFWRPVVLYRFKQLSSRITESQNSSFEAMVRSVDLPQVPKHLY